MAQLTITIDDTPADLEILEQSPALISYDLEDERNFQSKKSGTSIDVKFPATLANDKLFNTFRNPDIIDLSPDTQYRKPRRAQIFSDGLPVLVGKALLKSGTSKEKPESYTANLYGDNGDWMLDMQDLSLYECLPTNTHVFALYGGPGTAPPPLTIGPAPYGIEDSWFFDGTNSQQTWVYAPVRYGEAFAASDSDMKVIQMRPSLMVYWMLQRGFKKYGYQISSQFMDGAHFRRLVMPWTWGNFLGINTKLADLLKFRATGPYNAPYTPAGTPFLGAWEYHHPPGGSGGSGTIRPGIGGSPFDDFRLDNTTTNGGYDNNTNYAWSNATGMGTWTYKLANGYNFGKITAFFGVKTDGFVDVNTYSNASIYVEVYKNGGLIITHLMYDASAGISGAGDSGSKNFNFQVSGLLLGDTVSIKFRYTFFCTTLGDVNIGLYASPDLSPPSIFATLQTTYELFRIEIEPGGTVDWSNFQQFKQYKFLDMLRGVLDLFDLIPKTDPLTKTVYIEPAHGATIGATNYPGYFKTSRIDWSAKRDLSQETGVTSFDEMERDCLFQFADDRADGGVSVLANRYAITPGSGKYRFGSRFKEGTQTFFNRFFSSVVHLQMTQWQSISPYGRMPQIVAIVPERLSDTSSAADEPVYAPKICYYKGFILDNAGAGNGRFRMNGFPYAGYPYMFAVNYMPGGENDIALTYNDQYINGQIVPGLMRRFFLQRLAIQDHGVIYKPWMNLNNYDVTNWLHRERVVLGNNLYLLTNIDRWDPIHPISTQCSMWRFVPVETKNRDRCYPSAGSVSGTITNVPAPDMAYQRSFILQSDLPTFGS